MTESSRTFNALFAGIADRETDLSQLAAAPEPDRRSPAPGDPTPTSSQVLIDEVGSLRVRFEAFSQDLIREVRGLRRENTRLRQENGRCKALLREYKQLSGRG